MLRPPTEGPPPVGEKEPVLAFKHFTVAVHDLDEAVKNYQARLGLNIIGEKAHNNIGNFDFYVLGWGEQTFCHLICPSSTESPIHRLMQDRVNPLNPNGEGIYLLAFEAADTDAVAKQVEAGGGRVNRAPNTTNVWVHPLSTNFVLMELFQAK
jgi:predicted enzyme related to lactoylglutathione lyase